MKNFELLKKCPLFQKIKEKELSAMLDCLNARTLTLAKNETIFQEGSKATYVGLVLSGSVQIVQDDFYGNRSIIAVIHPPQLFAEAFACANVELMPVSVIAERPSEIMLIDCKRILSICTNTCIFHQQLINNLLRIVASKNLLLQQKIEVMSQRTTRDKLMTYLLSQAKLKNNNEFTIPYDRQALADYLGVERSALSAEIGKLRKEGVLESTKSHFRLLESESHL